MSERVDIDAEVWWRDPMGDALKNYFNHQHRGGISEPYAEGDDDVVALMQLELLLQAKVLRRLEREGYEFNPLVRAIAEVVGAAQEHIQEQALAALSA